MITLSSYSNGPFNGGAGNRTGAAGSSAGCSGSTCHSANTAATVITMQLQSGGQTVTQYTGGQTYTVIINGSNASGTSLPKFGFQAACVNAANTSTQMGTFAPSGSAAVRNGGTLQFVEHSAPISGTAAGGGWNYSTSFTWTAPAAGSGAVKFFVALNAVNNNGNSTGDQPNAANFTYSEATTGVAETVKNIEVKAYPNPSSNMVTIKASNATAGVYQLNVFDLGGRKVENKTITVNGAELETTISVSDWATGLYHIQLSKDGVQRVIPFVKQ